MCTYQTEHVALNASGKTARGWAALTEASVYFDHPVHFNAGHALMIDVLNPALGPDARVALELDARSARDLARTILAALDAVPAELIDEA